MADPEKILVKMENLIYHEDGQSTIELGDVWVTTIDGEGIVTKECICISYYGSQYSELCRNCDEWNQYVDFIETECSPNCACKSEMNGSH